MTVGGPMTLFDVAQRAMSAQLVRMNAAASNLANAGSVAGSEGEAYRPLRPVFAEQLDQASGLSSVRVDGVYRADVKSRALSLDEMFPLLLKRRERRAKS